MPFAIDEITINLLVDIPENKSIIDTLFIEDSNAEKKVKSKILIKKIKMEKATVKVYYEDLKIFENLGKTLEQPYYEVENYCKNFIVVSFPAGCNPQDFMNPYRQTEIYTRRGYFCIASQS
jgi:hypothetical protein